MLLFGAQSIKHFLRCVHQTFRFFTLLSAFCFFLVQDFCRFKPCFPGVPCFNDPATVKGFECGECPLGMLGDGINCTDINEVRSLLHFVCGIGLC